MVVKALVLALGTLLVDLPSRGVFAEDPRDEEDRELELRIRRAIDTGTAWLYAQAWNEQWFSNVEQSRKLTLKDPSWFGPRALAALALVHGTDGRPGRELAGIRDFISTCGSRSVGTYGHGLALMVLQALDEQARRGLALGWRSNWLDHRVLSERDRRAAREHFDALVSGVGDGRLWGYAGTELIGDCDAFHGQFGAMGVLAGTRLQLAVPRQHEPPVLRELLRWSARAGAAAEFHGVAESDSGLKPILPITLDGSVRPRGSPSRRDALVTDATSTASIVTQLLAWRGSLRGPLSATEASDAAIMQGVREGLAWVFVDFDSDSPPRVMSRWGPPRQAKTLYHREQAYYLWAVERMCSLAGVRSVGGFDWYRLGARSFLRCQHPAGCWRGFAKVDGIPMGFGPGPVSDEAINDTSFAVLFLARSGRRLLVPELLPQASRLDTELAPK